MATGLVTKLLALETCQKSPENGIWYPSTLRKELATLDRAYPEEWDGGFANPEYFDCNQMDFRLKENKSASQALKAFFAGPTVAECGSVLMALQYAELLEQLGSERFDAIFSDGTQMHIHGGWNRSTDALHYFLSPRLSSPDELALRHKEPGAKLHFKGAVSYSVKHPAGESGGWNVYRTATKSPSGEPLFVGFGLGAPVTQEQLENRMIAAYNQPRTPQDENFIARHGTQSWRFDMKGAPETVGLGHLGGLSSSCELFDVHSVMAAMTEPVETTRQRIKDHMRDTVDIGWSDDVCEYA